MWDTLFEIQRLFMAAYCLLMGFMIWSIALVIALTMPIAGYEWVRSLPFPLHKQWPLHHSSYCKRYLVSGIGILLSLLISFFPLVLYDNTRLLYLVPLGLAIFLTPLLVAIYFISCRNRKTYRHFG